MSEMCPQQGLEFGLGQFKQMKPIEALQAARVNSSVGSAHDECSTRTEHAPYFPYELFVLPMPSRVSNETTTSTQASSSGNSLAEPCINRRLSPRIRRMRDRRSIDLHSDNASANTREDGGAVAFAGRDVEDIQSLAKIPGEAISMEMLD